MLNRIIVFSIILLALVWPKSAIAQSYCAMAKDLKSFKVLAYDKLNLMAFANDGGLFNQGTCWWHTRLQQSSLYLATYKPQLARPGFVQAERIITILMTLRQVVEIPGYNNWYEFSRDWHTLIQKKLDDWQIQEGIFGFAWIWGLMGEPELPTLRLRANIEALRDEVKILGRIPFAKLQLRGIAAHSLLIVDVNPINNGYETQVIDSNYPSEVRKAYFVDGMRTFQGGVPYLERRKDFALIGQAHKRYCFNDRSRTWSLDNLSQSDLDRIILEDLAEYIEETRAVQKQ